MALRRTPLPSQRQRLRGTDCRAGVSGVERLGLAIHPAFVVVAARSTKPVTVSLAESASNSLELGSGELEALILEKLLELTKGLASLCFVYQFGSEILNAHSCAVFTL